VLVLLELLELVVWLVLVLLVLLLVELVLELLELELVVEVDVLVKDTSTQPIVLFTQSLYFRLSWSQYIFPGSFPWGGVPPGRFLSLSILLNSSSDNWMLN
jgi:hypothetical protein